MQTEVDLMKIIPHQREVLAALVRTLPNNEIARLLKIVEMVTPSPGVVSEATKQEGAGNRAVQIQISSSLGQLACD